MATGPEHYRKAQELLTVAEDDGTTIDGAMWRIAAAQAHATLALAAATALGTSQSGGAPWQDYTAWINTCSSTGS